MAIEGRYFTWTIQAQEDLADLTPGMGHLFRAISLEGKIARNALEAGGILLYGGRAGEHVTLGYAGILKFAAAEEILEGTRLTVRGSGLFYAAQQGEYVVGRLLSPAIPKGAPGMIATGMFNFATLALY